MAGRTQWVGIGNSRHRLARFLSAPLLLALGALLGGCGGPASTIFTRAAPTDAVVPYITASNYGIVASVVGLRGKDGTEAWQTPIGVRDNDGATAVVSGFLYIEAGAASTPSPQPPSDFILALRLSDGAILWRTPLPQADYRVGVVADDATVIAAAGAGGLYALDAATGAIRWHQAANLSEGLSGAPHLSGGVVLALIAGNPATDHTNSVIGLTAWRESDGALLWQKTSTSTIATNEYAAYSTLGDGASALSTQDGRQLWYYQSGRTVEGGGADNYNGELLAVSGQLALVQETFPVVSNDLPTKDHVAALDARSGKVLWQASPGFDGALTFGGPIVARSGTETTIYGGYKNQFLALRGADGASLWKDDLSPYALVQATYTGGVLFALLSPPNCELGPCFGPTTNRLEALNPATGAPYWERDLPDAVVLASG